MDAYYSLDALILQAQKRGVSLSQIVLEKEASRMGKDQETILAQLEQSVDVMEESLLRGISSPQTSVSGLTQGGAHKVETTRLRGETIGGSVFTRIVAAAMAVAEVNACMGRVVAAPTAGACGILPGVLLTVAQERGIGREQVVRGLLAAAGVGLVVATRATISGAEGGCQAECGAASGMAAAGLVEMLGGSPERIAPAVSFALSNLLGLVCDPVAGLVEVPCVARNVVGAVNALAAAEMALAGVDAVIPPDEVISAMREVGDAMPCALRETAQGGLAATPKGRDLQKRIFGEG